MIIIMEMMDFRHLRLKTKKKTLFLRLRYNVSRKTSSLILLTHNWQFSATRSSQFTRLNITLEPFDPFKAIYIACLTSTFHMIAWKQAPEYSCRLIAAYFYLIRMNHVIPRASTIFSAAVLDTTHHNIYTQTTLSPTYRPSTCTATNNLKIFYLLFYI